jgi:WD40 repeat protein
MLESRSPRHERVRPQVWDLETGELQRTLNGAHAGGVCCVAVNSGVICSGGYDFKLRLWTMKNGAHKQTIDAHNAIVLCIVMGIGMGGDCIVSGSQDCTAKVRDVLTSSLRMPGHAIHAEHEACMQSTPSTTRSPLGAGRVRQQVWDRSTGEQKMVLEGHTGAVNSVAMNGELIITASDDKCVGGTWSTLCRVKAGEGL